MSLKTENADRNAKLAIVLEFVNLLEDCCNTEYELSNIYLLADGNGRPIDWLHRWSFRENIKDVCFSPMWRDVRIAVDGYHSLGKYLKDNLPGLNDPVKEESFDWEISPESVVRNFKKLKEHLA